MPPDIAPIADQPSDTGGVGVRPAAPAWRIMVLAELENFATLRRQVGATHGAALAGMIAEMIAPLLPGAIVKPIGRTTIEIVFDGALPDEADLAIASIGAKFARPIQIAGKACTVDIALAGAAMPNHCRDDVRLVEATEAALRQAHVDRRPVVYDLSRPEHAYDRNALMRDLDQAIGNGEIFLHYQPKVHLRRQSVVSVEALVRWHHPVRGLILPGDFIALAEESGKIAELTLWTIRQAIADQQVLAAAGHDVPVFVNLSAVLLAEAEFVERVCRMVRGVPAKLGLEITETAVIRDPESAIRHLQVLAGIGVTLAIDDYGAGLSSLAYLKRLPASELKIDKMFILELASSNRDPLIVRSTIDLAHALDMEVTAEGVESPSAMALLSVMGCDMAQGFLISRPIGLGALCQFLDEDRHLSVTATARPSFGRSESFWARA